MNQKRQPKGIPVGGQFSANSHDEAGELGHETHDPSELGVAHVHDGSISPLSEEEFSSMNDGSYEEYITSYRSALAEKYAQDAEKTKAVILAAVESGLMKPARWTGGSKVTSEYETGDIYIGRTSDGGRMYVQYRAQIDPREHGSMEDPEVKVSPVRFSMTGSYIPKGDRIVRGGGQNDRDLLRVVPSEEAPFSTEDARELHALWNRNHLNDMNAGTYRQRQIVDAMTPEEKGNALEAYENTKKKLRESDMLEDRGYAYGSQWLAHNVSTEDVERTLELLGRGESRVLR